MTRIVRLHFSHWINRGVAKRNFRLHRRIEVLARGRVHRLYLLQFEHILLFSVDFTFNWRDLLEWLRSDLVRAILGRFDLGSGLHYWRWEAIEIIWCLLLH